MKIKIAALMCFLFLSLSFILVLQPAYASESDQKEDLTLIFSDYLDKLRVNCAFQLEDFTEIKRALEDNPPHLTNPISREAALALTTCYPYWDNFNQIIEIATPERIDYQKTYAEVKQMISQIRKNTEYQEEAHVKTASINLEMDFVDIPKGKYDNKLIGTFEISGDIAIQTTPVTQYQWAKIMGNNPSFFKTGEDSRNVEINGQQIEMCPNKPVESISREDITKFIETLNKQDNIYEYQLASTIEYLAVIGDSTQMAGSYCLNKKETCPVTSNSYFYLNDERIYSLLDNVLELTRDKAKDDDSLLVLFGRSYQSIYYIPTKLTDVAKPFYIYKNPGDNFIGFRLIRYKKGKANQTNNSYNTLWDDALPEVNLVDHDHKTSLMRAIEHSDIAAVKLLLDYNADTSLKDKWGTTALMQISGILPKTTSEQLVKMLVSKGADVNLQDHNGQTALVRATQGSDITMVELLLDHNPDTSLKDKWGKTALMYASGHSRHPSGIRDHHTTPEDLVKMLVSKGADVNLLDNSDWTALIHAITNGNIMAVKLLLDHNADTNLKDPSGKTALMYASGLRDHTAAEDLVKMLVSKGADVNQADYVARKTALVYATECGNTKVVKWLLDNGAIDNSAMGAISRFFKKIFG